MNTNRLNQLKLHYRFSILIGVLFLGYAVFGGLSFSTLNHLKVNGALYQQIIQGKDIVADILPPPEYILESYLTVRQLVDEADPVEQDKLIARIRLLKQEYDTRHAYWVGQPLEPEIQNLISKVTHEPALTFYSLTFDRLIPAVKKNDVAEIKATMAEMKSAYEMHRSAIDQLVSVSRKRTVNDEAEAIKQIQTSNYFLSLTLAISMALGIGLAFIITRGLIKSLGGEPNDLNKVASKIAEGKLDFKLEVVEGDQSSVMYHMEKMRVQLLERERLEHKQAEAELNLERAEREKLYAEQQALREAESREIYLSMVHAAHHILNNLLNQLQLFKIEAESHENFDTETLNLFDVSIAEARELILRLSSVTQLTKEAIAESVAPK